MPPPYGGGDTKSKSPVIKVEMTVKKVRVFVIVIKSVNRRGRCNFAKRKASRIGWQWRGISWLTRVIKWLLTVQCSIHFAGWRYLHDHNAQIATERERERERETVTGLHFRLSTHCRGPRLICDRGGRPLCKSNRHIRFSSANVTMWVSHIVLTIPVNKPCYVPVLVCLANNPHAS